MRRKPGFQVVPRPWPPAGRLAVGLCRSVLGGAGGAAGSGGTGTGMDAAVDGSKDVAQAQPDLDADVVPTNDCTGQADFTPCTVVTSPDRKYDICVAGTCVSDSANAGVRRCARQRTFCPRHALAARVGPTAACSIFAALACSVCPTSCKPCTDRLIRRRPRRPLLRARNREAESSSLPRAALDLDRPAHGLD
jgi:hypothetical protein